jgi:hypothetical protein
VCIKAQSRQSGTSVCQIVLLRGIHARHSLLHGQGLGHRAAGLTDEHRSELPQHRGPPVWLRDKACKQIEAQRFCMCAFGGRQVKSRQVQPNESQLRLGCGEDMWLPQHAERGLQFVGSECAHGCIDRCDVRTFGSLARILSFHRPFVAQALEQRFAANGTLGHGARSHGAGCESLCHAYLLGIVWLLRGHVQASGLPRGARGLNVVGDWR